MDADQLKTNDPVARQPASGAPSSGLSPMDPPDAYAPPSANRVDLDSLHPFLRSLVAEHERGEAQIASFEAALLSFQQQGPSRQAHEHLRDFFRYFDEEFVAHNRREERALFPLLHRRLIEVGEHSGGEDPTTAIDLLERDHRTALQLAAVTFNLLGVASRLPDENSRLLVLDAAIEQGKALVDTLKLHIFRENTIAFSLADQHLTPAELDRIADESPPEQRA